VGITASSEIKRATGSKKKGLNAAYVSQRIELDSGSRVVVASTDADLPKSCQRGQFAIVQGDCENYFLCEKQTWSIAHCPAGLAFNSQTVRCEWHGSVAGCEGNSSVVLDEVGCGKKSFFLAQGEAAQAMIKDAMRRWRSEAANSLALHARPEGYAAQKVLSVVGFDITSEEPPLRWAVFSPGENGTMIMQAVALVAKVGSNAIDIMAYCQPPVAPE